MKRAQGFTVIEIAVLIVLLAVGGTLFFVQNAQVQAAGRDTSRKIAINAMYYALEEVYYPQNHSYPSSIDSKVLRSVDPDLFVDPYGTKLGTDGADYHYDGTGCSTDGKCTGYTLKSTMEREGDYTKTNRNT